MPRVSSQANGLPSICTRAPTGGLGDPTPASAGHPTPVLRGDPELLPQAPHRLARDRQAVVLAQLLGHMRIVEPRVLGGHPPLHGFLRRGWRALATRGPAPTSMRQATRPLGFKAPLQPPHLTQAEVQGLGGLARGNSATTSGLYQSRALQFLAART